VQLLAELQRGAGRLVQLTAQRVAVHALVNGVYVALTSASAPTPPSTQATCVGRAGAHVATCSWADILELARACARLANSFTLAPPAPSFPAPTLTAALRADNDAASIANGASVSLTCSGGTLTKCFAVPYPGSKARTELTLGRFARRRITRRCITRQRITRRCFT
jgi:hypothetical protein